MTPQQRMQFGQQLIQSVQQQDHSFPDVNQDGIDDRLQDPDYLARTRARLDQQQPGLLDQLLGGIAAYGASRMLGGGTITAAITVVTAASSTSRDPT